MALLMNVAFIFEVFIKVSGVVCMAEHMTGILRLHDETTMHDFVHGNCQKYLLYPTAIYNN